MKSKEYDISLTLSHAGELKKNFREKPLRLLGSKNAQAYQPISSKKNRKRWNIHHRIE